MKYTIHNTKIVILGKSYEAALGIAWSLRLGEADNLDLYFIGKNYIIANKSNAFKNKHHCLLRDDERIIDNLLGIYLKEPGPKVLFPCDDYTTSLSDRYRNRLKNIFLFTFVEGDVEYGITMLMDKLKQYEIAESFGMPMAKSWVLQCDEVGYVIPNSIVFPCFVKPLVSAVGPAKSIIRRLDDLKELTEYLSQLYKKDNYSYPVLIQEYIEIEEEYNIHGICDGQRIFLPLIHKKLETAAFNRGVTILGKNLDPSHLGSAIDKLKDILKHCNYHGVFNVEMFKSKGITYLNEINFRISGTCWGTTMGGANLPSLWVNLLLGNVEEWPKLTLHYDSTFINDKTAMEDLINGYRGFFNFYRWIKAADYHLIKNKSDIGPWKAFLSMMAKVYLSKKKAKWLKRF